MGRRRRGFDWGYVKSEFATAGLFAGGTAAVIGALGGCGRTQRLGAQETRRVEAYMERRRVVESINDIELDEPSEARP